MAKNINVLPDELLSMVFSCFRPAPGFLPWPLPPDFDDRSIDKPTEAGDCPDMKHLFRVSLVCKRWSALVKPLWMQNIRITSSPVPERFQLSSYSHVQTVSLFVKHLLIDIPASPAQYSLAATCTQCKHIVLRFHGTWKRDDIADLAVFLSKLPGLKTVCLQLRTVDGHFRNSDSATALFKAMQEVLAGPGRSVDTLEVRGGDLRQDMNAFFSLARALPLRNLSLWDCAFPESRQFMLGIRQLNLNAFSFDGCDENPIVTPEDLQYCFSLRQLRLGYLITDQAHRLLPLLPQKLKELYITDPNYRMVHALLGALAAEPETLPELEIIGIGTLRMDVLTFYGFLNNPNEDPTAARTAFRNTVAPMRAAMQALKEDRRIQFKPADFFEQILETTSDWLVL